jgi:hypothetical protein
MDEKPGYHSLRLLNLDKMFNMIITESLVDQNESATNAVKAVVLYSSES